MVSLSISEPENVRKIAFLTMPRLIWSGWKINEKYLRNEYSAFLDIILATSVCVLDPLVKLRMANRSENAQRHHMPKTIDVL